MQTTKLRTSALTEAQAHSAEQLLMEQVRIPSTSYNEQTAVRHLVDWMSAHGYHAHIDDAGNAVGTIGTGERLILLLGHIDTFGGFPPVRREGRLLYGRGSVDAKGSLCAFAVAGALAQLHHARVMVVGAVEEECPTSKGARFIARTVSPDACIIGEPSNWDRVTLGYKGRLIMRWSWRGDLAHSASQTLSGAERAVAYWQHINAYAQAFNADKDRIFSRLDVTLQDINTAHEGEYGTATMTIGFRLPPTLSPDAVIEACQTRLTDSEGVTVNFTAQEHAIVAEKDNALTRAFRGAIRAIGGVPAFVHKTGTSDMNIVGRVWHCPIVAYGAGDSALDHTPQEHIDLDEYLRAIEVLVHVLSADWSPLTRNEPQEIAK